jgi:hypothetical protein
MNNTITIQSGIPIPSRHFKHKSRDLITEAMKRMVRGESFFVPGSQANYPTVNAARILVTGSTGNFYTCRTVTEGERGTRVWRIA